MNRAYFVIEDQGIGIEFLAFAEGNGLMFAAYRTLPKQKVKQDWVRYYPQAIKGDSRFIGTGIRILDCAEATAIMLRAVTPDTETIHIPIPAGRKY